MPWHSGVWLGGRFTTAQLNAFGVWRGRPADVTTTYGYRDSPELLAGNSWPIATWPGFGGRLNYGVPLATNDGRMNSASVASGQYDDTYRQVARNLVRYGRGDSIVRIGWEANLPDWKWYANAGNAATFKAAFRSASKAMRSAAPNLVVEFGIACGGDLDGSRDRLAALTTLYPGDDVVDLVGCDTYDWWNTKADGPDFSRVLKPAGGVGIQDVADFARAHAKGASYGEWGLAVRNNGNGGGDDPYYIESMFAFFQANADVVAFENYFDEPDPYIGNSLVVGGQNPRAAAVYRRLCGLTATALSVLPCCPQSVRSRRPAAVPVAVRLRRTTRSDVVMQKGRAWMPPRSAALDRRPACPGLLPTGEEPARDNRSAAMTDRRGRRPAGVATRRWPRSRPPRRHRRHRSAD